MKKIISLIALLSIVFSSCKKDDVPAPIVPVLPITVTDIDGNVYNTITIGTQTWMKENLKTTRYRNGDAISNITDKTAWSTLTTSAYANLNNDAANVATYGRLYNWYAATDSRNIAPAGWHVPSDAEWTTLFTYLGGETVAGGKLKEAGFAHWLSPNTDADNSSGFTGLPGGIRYSNENGTIPNGSFFWNGFFGVWWSSTEFNTAKARDFSLYKGGGSATRLNTLKGDGESIRCLKD